ncbi:MAG: MFS transporter [Sphingobacteriia bacterium]|nr:MFS transporter [Sphingobacteriia bacterium]
MAKISKKDSSILIANILDHFDTAIYGLLAPILAPLFFPKFIPEVQLILAYSVLATSLFTRPLGAFIFGILAKNSGPAIALTYSLMGVAITTFFIGCLPTYETLGWIAPFCLILLRMIKGLCASGESTIASLYIIENKPKAISVSHSNFYNSTTVLGILLASLITVIVTNFKANEYLWRIPFLLGAFTGFIAYRLRKELRYFEKQKTSIFKFYSFSNLIFLWKNKYLVLRIAIIDGFSYLTYSVPFVFMNAFIPLISSISLESMMYYNSILLILDFLLIPIISKIIRRFKFASVMILSSFIFSFTLPFLFYYAENSSIYYVTFIRIWIIILGVTYLTPLNVWLNSLFNSNDKYFLIGIGRSLGSTIIGRSLPMICLSIWHFTHSIFLTILYISLLGIMTLITIISLKNVSNISLQSKLND